MKRMGKRLKEAVKTIDTTKTYALEDAIGQVSSFPKVKFDETIELHFHLNINTRPPTKEFAGP